MYDWRTLVDPCEVACNVSLRPVQAVSFELTSHTMQSLSQALYKCYATVLTACLYCGQVWFC